MNIDIPQRAKNEADFPQLKVLDKRIISYAVLCQTGNEEAFMRFHPEYLRADGKGMNEAGKTESKHFWSYGKNREYRQAYEATLEEFFGRRQTNRSVDTEIDDTRIEGALKKLLNQTIGLLDNGDNLDPDSVKTIVEVFRKMNLLKDDVEQQVKPLRFLPERCFSSCRYRLFVENAVKGGELISECDYCRALRYARENGFKGDDTNMLDLPKEVLDAEPENTVSTLDILAGKIDN